MGGRGAVESAQCMCIAPLNPNTLFGNRAHRHLAISMPVNYCKPRESTLSMLDKGYRTRFISSSPFREALNDVTDVLRRTLHLTVFLIQAPGLTHRSALAAAGRTSVYVALRAHL